MRHWIMPSLVQIMACHLFDTRPLSELMLPYCQLDPRNIFQWNFIQNSKVFIQGNALENVALKMADILSRPQCVNRWKALSKAKYSSKIRGRPTNERVYFSCFVMFCCGSIWDHFDGLVQERRNSSALAMELRLSCTNPSILCLTNNIQD